MIKIIQYGLGNILAFANVYKRLGIEVKVAENADDLKDAGRIILPGVGSFGHAMELLEESGMRETLDEKVLGQRVPVLGVCVGMRIMANLSQEGKRAGLGWIDGDVRMQIGRAQVGTQATNAHLVCRLRLKKKNNK